MITIPYYEVVEVTGKQMDALMALGTSAANHGYKFHNNHWYRRVGYTGAPDSAAKESRNRPLTLKEIQTWPEK